MRYGVRLRLVFLVVATLPLVGQLGPRMFAQETRLPVVATFSILGDMVRNVGGDRIALTTLVGTDADTHSYEPTPGDARTLAAATLSLENGLGFESWLDRLYASSRSSARRVVVSEGIDPLTLNEGGRMETDPHVWHDVAQGMRMVATVRDALVQADPAGADVYTANAAAYLARLQELDAWVVEQVATIPPEQRKLVTSHDSLGYYARRYGFEIIGTLLPVSAEGEPSASRVAALVRDIRATGATAIFPENVVNQRLLTRVAAEARISVAPALYTDALGGPDSAGSTYIRMMQYNTATIVGALRGWR